MPMKLFSRVTAALAAAAINSGPDDRCDEQKIKELEEGLSTEADVRAVWRTRARLERRGWLMPLSTTANQPVPRTT